MNRNHWCSVVWAAPSESPVWSGRWAPPTGRPVLPGLSVFSSLAGCRWRVVARGELNLMTAPLLDGALEGPGRPGLVAVLLDLGRVTFLDVAGVASLQRADRLVERRGLGLVVAPPVASGPARMLLLAVGMGLLRPVFGGNQGTGRVA